MCWLESTDGLQTEQLHWSVAAGVELCFVEHRSGMPEEAVRWALGGEVRDVARERGASRVLVGPVERRSHADFEQSFCRVVFV